MKLRAGLVAGLSGWLALAAGAAQPAERFTFIAMGCMPYGKANYPAYERLLAEINRQRPAFTVHCGDTKGGSEPPSDAFLQQQKTWFDGLEGPVIYTPGDNEWTDVHTDSNRINGVRQEPAVWLAKVRALYFPEERSLGKAPIPLVTQRREKGMEKFVENARWTRGGVVFATVHAVGSRNNNQPAVPGAVEEFREREAANAAWVRATFAEARASQAPGVALFFQAEPFNAAAKLGAASGFTVFLATIAAEAKAFGKPVLLVHADEHRYRLEPKIAFPGGETLDNVTRLETFGAVDIHAVQVTVDPESTAVFLAGPLLVPGNALPVLPRPAKPAGKK